MAPRNYLLHHLLFDIFRRTRVISNMNKTFRGDVIYGFKTKVLGMITIS